MQKDLNIDIFALESVSLINKILQQNRSYSSLDKLRQEAKKRNSHSLTLNKEGLLLYRGLLVVPNNKLLRTQLITEAYTPSSSVYPSPSKTIKILRERYWWSSIRIDIIRYISNCREYRAVYRPRDKTPGLLYPLPIPQYR